MTDDEALVELVAAAIVEGMHKRPFAEVAGAPRGVIARETARKVVELVKRSESPASEVVE